MARAFVSAAIVLLLCAVVNGATQLLSNFETFWQNELPGVAMPATLKLSTSPLSAFSDRLLFAHLLAGSDPRSLNDQLCSSAPVYCAQDATVIGGPQPRVCIPPFFNYEYGVLPCEFAASDVAPVAASGIFFFPRALSPGRSLHLPDTANDLSKVAFLPGAVAHALPVDVDHLPELQSLFGVSERSQMELEMKNTVTHCSFHSDSHEVRGCAASGEALVTFVHQNLGSKLIVLSATASSEQQVKVAEVKPVNRGAEKSAICHSMRFPSLVYSCHMVPTTQVFDVSIVESDGKLAQALVVCHSDTSYWNPSHIAFKVLETEPGNSGICHWLPENTLVFAQRNVT